MLKSQILRREKLENYERFLNSKPGSVDWKLGDHDGAGRASAERRAFVNALRYGVEELRPQELEHLKQVDIRDVATSPGTAGGFIVPTVLMPSLLIKLRYFGGMREAATQITTQSGNPLAWGTMNDTGNTGELVAENVVASTSDLVFGNVTSTPSRFSSKIVPVSIEILRDNAVDIESLIPGILATRLGRVMNSFFTFGTGISQPQGVLTAAALGVTLPTGNTTTIPYDSIVDLFHSVDKSYRENAGCAWMMHDLTWAQIKRIKDANGRPIWMPAVGAAGFADSSKFGAIFGKKIVINNDVQIALASNKTVLFGDFSKYLILDVEEIVVMRFADSPYASKGQVGFLALARSDGRMIDFTPTAAIQYLQQSAT
ncbi:MAG: phage major capsid protein [Methylocella sp.]